MEIIKTTPIELPVIIAGVYRLRREEVIGIKWNAIDFKAKTLTIRHTYKKFYGNTYCNDYKDYICLMENGELIKPGYVTQTFSKILDNNNLRHIRLHDLRHSCGTLLIQNGVPVKDIQIWLGHSNFQTTLRYAHADIENKRISASVISDKLALDTKDTKKEQITELAL